jgi:predicted metalloprotease with PDZ domain
VLPDNGAGLEHLDSTVIGVDPWMFADARGKQKFWSVSAHEFFHLWNVERIRPAVLGPFDYDHEVHTTMLWFSEGFTSYYATLINSRAGLLDERQARDELARRIAAIESKPGHRLISVEQSSWDTWAPPDDRDKAYYSYYDKGAVLGMLFDLHLRHATGELASTDSVFRALWKQWRETGLGLTPAQLEQAFVEQAGPGADELRKMFADYVRGTAPLDYDRYLAHAGYRLLRQLDHPGPWIGASVERQGEQLRVRLVEHDGPGDRGGLADGDVIRAIDGRHVGPDAYAKALASLALDQPHTFTVERNARTLTLSITPIEGGETRYEIVELDDVTPEQLALRKRWLGLR